MFSIDGVSLLYSGAAVFQAPDDIMRIYFQSKFCAILKYTSQSIAEEKGYFSILPPQIKNRDDLQLINQNILCVSNTGKIVWRIGLCDQLTTHADPYNYIYEEKGHWIAVTDRGHECDLDIETGKVSNTRYFASR